VLGQLLKRAAAQCSALLVHLLSGATNHGRVPTPLLGLRLSQPGLDQAYNKKLLTPCGLTACQVQQTHLVHLLSLQLSGFQLLLEHLTLLLESSCLHAYNKKLLTPCGLTACQVQQTHLVHLLGLQLAGFQLLLERLTLRTTKSC
jgi:hypothetical protein